MALCPQNFIYTNIIPIPKDSKASLSDSTEV